MWEAMRLLITDLDNTLYDWVNYFALSFRAMVNELSLLLSVDKETLKDEFKAVHQRHNSSEFPFAILELPSVRDHFGSASRSQLFKYLRGPLDAFKQSRNKHLELYPSVFETLQYLRSLNVLVVGHTEAIAELAFHRLQILGILPFFTHLYALDGSLEPHPDSERDAGALGLPPALVTFVPSDERKPNPRLLRDICSKEGVPISDTMYVGDSLTRDVSMAKSAGATAVWARYGTRYSSALWSEVVRVTHWTDEHVTLEARLREQCRDIRPDHTIDSFSEIINLFGYGESEDTRDLATVLPVDLFR
jgi:FMN phosphatase YigB (HAD superfamily)